MDHKGLTKVRFLKLTPGPRPARAECAWWTPRQDVRFLEQKLGEV